MTRRDTLIIRGIPPGGALVGNTEFARMVAERAPVIAMALNDPASIEALRKLASQQNVSAAPVLSPEQAAVLGVSGRSRTGEGASGARYDTMDGGTANGNWSTHAGLAQMRDYAVQQGIPWAVNNPDLLRLGPAALAILADVQLRQESYRRLTKEAGFTAKDVVRLAEHAKKNGIDANELSSAVADVNKGLNANEQKKHNEALMGFMLAKPEGREAAGTKLREVQDNLVHAHPERKGEFERLHGILEKKGQQANAAEAAKKGTYDAFDAAGPERPAGTDPSARTANAAPKP
jgi:hypothetical protein